MDWRMKYYKKENGDIPALDFPLSLEAKMRAKALSEIELLEKHGPDLEIERALRYKEDYERRCDNE